MLSLATSPTFPLVYRGTYSLYVTEEAIGKIARLDVSPSLVVTIGHQFRLSSSTTNPRGIILGFDGKIWFTEGGNDSVGNIDPATGTVTECRLDVAINTKNCRVVPQD